MAEAQCEQTGEARPSVDSTASNLVTSPAQQRHHKSAVSSLRHHLPRSTGFQNRDSVSSIADRANNETRRAAVLEASLNHDDCVDEHTVHKRNSSVSQSLMGSLRGFRRTTHSRRAQSPEKVPSGGQEKENITEPSSPINIPAAAPMLDVDLGTGQFMPPTFDLSLPEERAKEIMKLIDPANFATGAPRTYNAHFPDSVLLTPERVGRTITSIERVESAAANMTTFDIGTPNQPTTPMPGTTFCLEVDGANGDTLSSDKSNVFERSVTPRSQRGHNELRAMRSLDAMAEACTIAHASDDAQRGSEMTDNVYHTAPGTPLNSTSSLAVRAGSSKGDVNSGSTKYSCPSDMEKLSRQEARRWPTPSSDPFAGDEQHGRGEDPLLDLYMQGTGPPSPTRSLDLPFRPKLVGNARNSLMSNVEHDKPALPITQPLVEDRGNLSSSVCQSSTAETSTQAQHMNSKQIHELSSPVRSERRLSTIFDGAEAPHWRNDAETTWIERKASVKPPFVTQADTVLHEDSLHSYDALLSPSSQRDVTSSRRSCTTYTTGLGDVGYRYVGQNWLRTPSGRISLSEGLRTAPDESPDGSIDLDIAENGDASPDVCQNSSSNNGAPAATDGAEFHARQALRNMSSNVLHNRRTVDWLNEHSREQAAVQFDLDGSESDNEVDSRNEATESAPDLAQEINSQEPSTPLESPNRFMKSVDSVASSLRNVVLDYSRLGDLLNSSSSPIRSRYKTANFSRSQPSSPSKSVKEFAGSSTQASPLEQALERAKLAGAEDQDSTLEFSPTTAVTDRSNITPNRLAILDEQKTTSPEDRSFSDSKTVMYPSSADSPLLRGRLPGKGWVSPADTLDEFLHAFSSPDSGYQGDMSSIGPETPARDEDALDARSPSNLRSRERSRKIMGEMSSNIA